jgi:stage II sporulation protein AA (anti-sigma F factor antagonist)
VTHTDRADRQGRLFTEHRVIGGIRIVTLRGEIDHDVQDMLCEALPGGEGAASTRIVADLSGVTFMDSTGINVFVAAHLRATEAAGWVRIASARLPVRRVLQVTGVGTFIPCHPCVEQALTAEYSSSGSCPELLCRSAGPSRRHEDVPATRSTPYAGIAFSQSTRRGALMGFVNL